MTIHQKTIEFSWTHPLDPKPIGELFAACFQAPFSDALWKWKYGKDPKCITAWTNGQAIGHYAGIPRTILLMSESISMVQITDVMVHPKERTAYGKKGIFFQMASRFLERYVGYDKEFLQAFGFPNERHTRLGILLGVYGRADKMWHVEWQPLAHAPFTFYKNKTILHSDATLTRIIPRLWQRMQGSLTHYLVPKRDTGYIIHRYFQHPEIKYQVHGVFHRILGHCKGVFVLRPHENSSFELMDLMADAQDMPMVLAFARYEVARQKGLSLFSWMSEPMANQLGKDAKLTDIQVTVPCITWTPCPPPEELQGKWWLMSGDTDWR
jgi:hypothetical protein